MRHWKEEEPRTDLWQMICHLTNLVDRLFYFFVLLCRDGAVTSRSRHSSDFPMQWRVTSSIFVSFFLGQTSASPGQERHGPLGLDRPFLEPPCCPLFSLAKVAPPTRTTAPKSTLHLTGPVYLGPSPTPKSTVVVWQQHSELASFYLVV